MSIFDRSQPFLDRANQVLRFVGTVLGTNDPRVGEVIQLLAHTVMIAAHLSGKPEAVVKLAISQLEEALRTLPAARELASELAATGHPAEFTKGKPS